MQSKTANKRNKKGRKASNNDPRDNRIIVMRGVREGSVGTLIKRLTLFSTVSTNAASGLITFVVTRASNITSANEWASYAARFRSYRVRKLRVTFFPASTSTQADPIAAANSTLSSCLVTSTFGVNVPLTIAEALADGECQLSPTVGREPFYVSCTWDKNPASKLYTSTGSAIPALSDFGIALGSHPLTTIGVNLVATRIFSTIFEYIAEFKDPS